MSFFEINIKMLITSCSIPLSCATAQGPGMKIRFSEEIVFLLNFFFVNLLSNLLRVEAR